MTELKHTSIRVTVDTANNLNRIAKLCNCRQNELVECLIFTDESELIKLVQQRIGLLRDLRAKEKQERLALKREQKAAKKADLKRRIKEDPESITKEELLSLLKIKA